MFNISTKIAVLASSNTKSIGPKYGSIGYAAIDDGIRYSAYLLDKTDTEGMILARSIVMFTRYGFGKERPKHEYKPILNVFPIINKSVKIEDMEKTISKVISKFRKENFENKFWLNSRMNLTGSTDVNVCIMAPVLTLGTDLRTCSNLEFSAWFNNMLNIYSMKTSIARINVNHYLNKLPSEESRRIVTSLRNCISDGSNKARYLDEIIGSPETRAPVVELLRLLHSISRTVKARDMRKQTRLGFKNGEFRYSKGNPNVNSNLFKAIVYDLFSDHTFETTRQMAPKSLFIARVGHTKRIFELMAHEIAKKNKEWDHLQTERG